jgi:hypothetical protein
MLYQPESRLRPSNPNYILSTLAEKPQYNCNFSPSYFTRNTWDSDRRVARPLCPGRSVHLMQDDALICRETFIARCSRQEDFAKLHSAYKTPRRTPCNRTHCPNVSSLSHARLLRSACKTSCHTSYTGFCALHDQRLSCERLLLPVYGTSWCTFYTGLRALHDQRLSCERLLHLVYSTSWHTSYTGFWALYVQRLSFVGLLLDLV